jgi:hypothetical protein
MRFQKRQVHTKKKPKFLPVIPLLPMKLSSEELKDKAAYIPFTLPVSKGSAPGTPTYRKSIRTFEEEDPQKWMSKCMRKPYKMGAKQFVTTMSRINNYILFFPNAMVHSTYSKEELLGILEFAVLPHWRKAFDLRDNLPTSDDKARFIEECEHVERNKAPPARERDNSDDDCRSNKKTKFAKPEKSATKSGHKTDTESVPKYCTHCKTDTHNAQSAAGSWKK